MSGVWTLRVARPTNQLEEIAEMYRFGLGLTTLARFVDHEGFSGVILGDAGHPYHFEFTTRPEHGVAAAPDPDDLLVFYVPSESEWEAGCARMIDAGFRQVPSLNPYWDVAGRTFADLDGYRVVLQRGIWAA
ncbi:MAG TPA: VOC family protein [Gemmatimonadaceae bacterium]|jgi:prolyl oligopeptidase|nr:VOC family protein [Gemmatimonadaceae bacterium]